MLTELVAIGGLVVAVVGVLEVSVRLQERPGRRLTPEAAIREAMRGPEAGVVRAEFRRSGISPPDRPRPAVFL